MKNRKWTNRFFYSVVITVIVLLTLPGCSVLGVEEKVVVPPLNPKNTITPQAEAPDVRPTTTEYVPLASPTELPTNVPEPAATDIPTMTPTATEVVEQVSANMAVTGRLSSNAAGEAIYLDPLKKAPFTVVVQDRGNFEPVADAQVWFMSVGTKVLVVAIDPKGIFIPAAKVFSYGSPSNSSEQIPLTKFETFKNNHTAWINYLAEMPDIDDFVIQTHSMCSTPSQAKQGLGVDTGFLFGALLPEDQVTDDKYYDGVETLLDAWAKSGANQLLDGYAAHAQPINLGFKVFNLKDDFPNFIQMTNVCTPVIDQADPQSIIDAVLYSLNSGDVSVFDLLAKSDYGYANYLEGGQPKTKAEFLTELSARLPSQPSCDSITRASDDSFEIWTSGWSPAWTMDEFCYIDCGPIDPPYQSTVAGFFFWRQGGLWKNTVTYLNSPENYFFIDNYARSACNTAFDEIPMAFEGDPGSEGSCPGAPPQRMVIEERGYVCTEKDKVILREGPGKSYNTVTLLAPGTYFKVKDGPICSDDWSWWKIRTDDKVVGWITEGGDNIDPYFICPSN